MPTLEEIKGYLDGLTPEEQKVAQEYLSSLQGIQEVKKEELATNLSTESKEVAKKSLEFEEDTFKIDSTSWKEETRTVNGTSQKVKISPEGDVLEYLEGLQQGEQLFVFDYKVQSERERFFGYITSAKGCSIEEVEQKYFLTEKEFDEKMKDKPSESEAYKQWAKENIKKKHLAGCWIQNVKNCCNVGILSNIWLAGGSAAGFHRNNWNHNGNYASLGFSVRLLKN